MNYSEMLGGKWWIIFSSVKLNKVYLISRVVIGCVVDGNKRNPKGGLIVFSLGWRCWLLVVPCRDEEEYVVGILGIAEFAECAWHEWVSSFLAEWVPGTQPVVGVLDRTLCLHLTHSYPYPALCWEQTDDHRVLRPLWVSCQSLLMLGGKPGSSTIIKGSAWWSY